MESFPLIGACLIFLMFVALGLFFSLVVIAAARLERLDERLEHDERLAQTLPAEPLPHAGQAARASSPTTSVPPV
jgi:hypothetical protein